MTSSKDYQTLKSEQIYRLDSTAEFVMSCMEEFGGKLSYDDIMNNIPYPLIIAMLEKKRKVNEAIHKKMDSGSSST